ncbi:MAG TPA: MlaD family protein [Cyclobacteriaceae bacterium]|nr:MlaD family protein [Cyclobacteriaceae bacterium]
MEEQDVKQRVKLGAFVLGGLTLFLISVFFIGAASNFFSRTFVVSAIFKNVEGLKEGDKVWLTGVQIGTVKSVRIVTVGEVVVMLSLKEKQNEFIRKNATASIGSDGFIGNKIVVISPGNSPEVIHDDDTISAVSPADTQQLLSIAKEVGENTRSITLDIKAISGKIKQGEGLVGELLNDGAFAHDLRKTVHGLEVTSENAVKASGDLSSVTRELKTGKGLLPTILSDTTEARAFKESVGNIKKVSASAASMSKSLDSVTLKMNSHDNAVGVLLADTTFAHNMQLTMKNIQEASVKLDENMEALKHNFLTRGYFRKKAKQEKKEAEKRAKEQGK